MSPKPAQGWIPGFSFVVAVALAWIAGPSSRGLAFRVPQAMTEPCKHVGTTSPSDDRHFCEIDGRQVQRRKAHPMDFDLEFPELKRAKRSALCLARDEDASMSLKCGGKGPTSEVPPDPNVERLSSRPAPEASIFIQKEGPAPCCHTAILSAQASMEGRVSVGPPPRQSWAAAQIGDPGEHGNRFPAPPAARVPLVGEAGGQWDANCNGAPEGRFERVKLWARVRTSRGLGGGNVELLAFILRERDTIVEGQLTTDSIQTDLSTPEAESDAGLTKTFEKRNYGFDGLVRAFDHVTFVKAAISGGTLVSYARGSTDPETRAAPDASALFSVNTDALRARDLEHAINLKIQK